MVEDSPKFVLRRKLLSSCRILSQGILKWKPREKEEVVFVVMLMERRRKERQKKKMPEHSRIKGVLVDDSPKFVLRRKLLSCCRILSQGILA